ncbi:MAG: hypothetical protein ACYTBJ_24465 [Planctomycetota bacterium]|jgi:hypothetical protein
MLCRKAVPLVFAVMCSLSFVVFGSDFAGTSYTRLDDAALAQIFGGKTYCQDCDPITGECENGTTCFMRAPCTGTENTSCNQASVKCIGGKGAKHWCIPAEVLCAGTYTEYDCHWVFSGPWPPDPSDIPSCEADLTTAVTKNCNTITKPWCTGGVDP